MHDQMIDDASRVTEHRAKGRKRSVAVLLAAVVAMVTIVAGVSPAGASPPASNPALVVATVSAGNPNAATVTWTSPPNLANVTGYVVTPNPVAPTTLAQTPSPIAVTGAGTLTLLFPGLFSGGTYTFSVSSVGTAGEILAPATVSNQIIASGPLVLPFQQYQFTSSDAAITRHFQEFLQRVPNFSELVFWRTYFFNNKTQANTCQAPTPPQRAIDTSDTSIIGAFCPNSGPEFDLITFLIFGDTNAFDSGGYSGPAETGRNTYAGLAEPVARLYQAYFLRAPDFGGFKFWYNQFRNGKSLDSISSYFAASSEFKRTYGALSDADFVSLVYNNVLARVSDFGGQNYWRGQLEAGRSRGYVMTRFSESNEYKNIVNYNVKTTTLVAALLGRAPTQAQLDASVFNMNNLWTGISPPSSVSGGAVVSQCFNSNPPGNGYAVYLSGTTTILAASAAVGADCTTAPVFRSGTINPVLQLLSTLRNSPAYKVAVAKPAGLI